MDLIWLFSTYNPSNVNVFPAIKTCETYLRNNEQMHNALQNYNIINSKRQPKNLKRLLTSSRFDSGEISPSVLKCNVPRCGTCNLLIEGQTYKFKNSFEFSVKKSMNCKSKNVIYSVICANCEDFYIGQTGDELRHRITVHRQQIKTANLRHLHVSKHIHRCANSSFRVFPIYQMFNDDITQREVKEKMFIELLKPKLNSAQRV